MTVLTLVASNSTTSNGSTSTASQTTFFAINGGLLLNLQGTESQVQVPMPADGTFSAFAVNASANTRTTATTATFRNSGVDGTQTVSIPASTTGWFADNAHSDTVNSGNLYSGKQVTGTGTGSLTMSGASLALSSATPTYPLAASIVNNSFYIHHVRDNSFSPLAGEGDTTTTENNVITKIKAMTAHTYFAVIHVNSDNAAGSWNLRKNSAAANNSVAVGAGVTGLLIDNTHTDTYVDNDTCSQFAAFSASTSGSCDSAMAGCWADVATYQNIFPGESSSKAPASNPYYMTPLGRNTWFSTEAPTQVYIPYTALWSHYQLRLSSNTSTADTLHSRINGVNGNQSIVLPASGSSSYLTDSTHVDALKTGDLISILVNAGTSGEHQFMDDGSTIVYGLGGAGIAILPIPITIVSGTSTFVGGSGVGTLAAPVASVSGMFTFSSGSGNAVLPLPSSAVSGVLGYSGAGAVTLPPLLTADSGVLLYSGSGSSVLPLPTTSGAGTLSYNGTASFELPQISLTSAGFALLPGSALGSAFVTLSIPVASDVVGRIRHNIYRWRSPKFTAVSFRP